MGLTERVLSRFLQARGGVTLLPDFKKALDRLQGGDPEPMQDFAKRVIDFVFPAGDSKVAPWYHGLGTAKRNAINSLQKELRVFQMEAPALRSADPRFLQSWVRRLGETAKNVRTLELASVVTDEARTIRQGGFTIHPMPGVAQASIKDALECLEAAEAKLRSVFPQVIYGDVFFSTHLQKGKAAWYVPGEDKFYLDIGAQKRFDDVYTIIHELGHRFDEKFFKDKDLRQRFWHLSTRKEFEFVNFDQALRKQVAEELLAVTKARRAGQPMSKLSDDAMLWVTTRYTPGADIRQLTTGYLAGEIDDGTFVDRVMGREDIKVYTPKLLHGPLAVTPYGGTKPGENFAEAFAHYVLGMKMPEELHAILDQLK